MKHQNRDPARLDGNPRDQSIVTDVVFEAELKDIQARREAMFGKPTAKPVPAERPYEELKKDLVGLALSGGGVRSAAFNNGVLQALIQTGLIRWIDYMSTVSGGGYIGGCLSTVLNEERRKRGLGETAQAQDGPNSLVSADSAGEAESHEDAEPINGAISDARMNGDAEVAAVKGTNSVNGAANAPAADASATSSERAAANERQCPEATRALWNTLKFPPNQQSKNSGDEIALKSPFYRGGQYVRDGRQFMESLVWGGLCNMLIWASLLIFGSALVAFAWRLLDFPGLTTFIRHHAPLGHHLWWNDFTRPFLFSFLLLALWIGFRIADSFQQRGNPSIATPPYLRNIFFAFAVSVPIGLAVLLSNSEASNRHDVGAQSSIVETGANPMWIMFAVVGALMLPYLNPLRLARSELRPVGRVESLLMGWAGLGLLLAVPFTAVYLFASEDQMGVAAASSRDLHQVDFRWPPEFLQQLADEAADGPQPPTVGASAFKTIQAQWSVFPQNESFRSRLNKLAQRYGCHDEVAIVRRLAHADEQQAEGALRLWNSFLKYRERRNNSDPLPWLRSLKERRMYCERAIREAIGEHIAEVMQKSVLSDSKQLETLRGQFSRQDLTDEERSFFANMGNLQEGPEFMNSLWPKVLASSGSLPKTDLLQINRLMFEALYPDLVRPRTQTSFHMTWCWDQIIRALWIGGGLLVFLFAAHSVGLNATSLQGFYQEKLRDAYFAGDAKLSELNSTTVGGPYQIFCAALNYFDDVPWHVAEYSHTYTFIFSRHFCGSQSLSSLDGDPSTESNAFGGNSHGYAATSSYCDNQLDVPTAAAISGAAFSPAIFRNPFMTLGTFLLNLRLGQWLPNPKHEPDGPRGERESREKTATYVTAMPVIRDFLKSILGKRRKPEDWKYCFVSDGGHNDNLGLAPLVMRRCRLIIVSDASQDENYEFEPLLKFYRRMRTRFGMDLMRYEPSETSSKPFDLAPLRPKRITASNSTERRLASRFLDAIVGKRRTREEMDVRISDQTKEHFILATLTYPDKSTAVFVYLKPSFTGDEPVDLVQYRHDHPAFPHDPTTDQMYTEDRVESYRRLGHHIGMRLCDRLQRGLVSSSEDLTLWDASYSVGDLIEKLGHRTSSREDPRIKYLIKMLDGKVSQVAPAKAQLIRLGRRVVLPLCHVNVRRSLHTENQRMHALQILHQILMTSTRELPNHQLMEIEGMAFEAKANDSSWTVRGCAEEVYELAAKLRKAARHDNSQMTEEQPAPPD